MRRFILAFAASLALVGVAHAETIEAKVDGMVCAFCATTLEESFKEDPAVESVAIDLEAKTVTLTTKAGADLSDAAIKKRIDYAGYTLSGIKRMP
jgi:copper chaperone CopZ